MTRRGLAKNVSGSLGIINNEMVFILNRATNWGGCIVKYIPIKGMEVSTLKIGQLVRGTITPDLDTQKMILLEWEEEV